METIEEMFEHHLVEMYYVETSLVDVLEKMADDASDDDLSEGFSKHRAETREHVRNLETVFRELGHEPEPRQSMVFDAMIEERERFYGETDNEQLRDLYDMQAGIKNERMEITGYEGMLTLADKLDYPDDVTDPLEDNLSEERSTLREMEALSKGSKLKGILGQLLS